MALLNPEAPPFLPLSTVFRSLQQKTQYSSSSSSCSSSSYYQPPLLAPPQPPLLHVPPPPPPPYTGFPVPQLQYYYCEQGLFYPPPWWSPSVQSAAAHVPLSFTESLVAPPPPPVDLLPLSLEETSKEAVKLQPTCEILKHNPDRTIPPPPPSPTLLQKGGASSGPPFRTRKKGVRTRYEWRVANGGSQDGCMHSNNDQDNYGRMKFVPKTVRCRTKKLHAGEVISQEEFEFTEEKEGEEITAGSGGRTTVMIKNIPNKYTKEMLLNLLDRHCFEVNQKVQSEMMQQTVLSEFDFFYLPMDFSTGSNLGYAFVNFTSAVAAWRLYHALHRKRWLFLGSRKVCEVTFARIQGLEALKKHFDKSTFVCNSDELLPVAFLPHRNGGSCGWQQSYFGKRIPT